MKFKNLTGSALGLLAVGSLAWGCSGQSSDCSANDNCGAYSGGSAGTTSTGGATAGNAGTPAGGSGGKSGAGGGSGSGASGMSGAGEAGAAGSGGVVPCDTTKAPTAEACLVTDDYGIFVAPSGDDTNAGSMSAPVKTITKAIALAQTDGKFVIACDGTYDEQVNIVAGVELYGGFTCPGGTKEAWAADAGGRAKVAPSIREIALNITSTVAEVHLENFEFDAQDGVIAGQSSIAAFVNGATKVTFTGVKLVAGKGVDGANGTRTDVVYESQATISGKNAVGNAGGGANVKTCKVDGIAIGTTVGGKGGDGGTGTVGPGSNGSPDLGTPTAGKGGAQGSSCAAGGSGTDGKSASPQGPSSGASSLGNIGPTGWSGAPGSDGTPGTPGQGGGGGTGAVNGTTSVEGGGGGGGAGGCGGAGGKGGKAGGSSIALLVSSSTVFLSSSDLTANDAGKGGSGISGQLGQSPGGSAGSFAGDGCAGGKGGLGGTGAASGGGAGGISVGIAWSGTSTMDPTPTTMMATTITTGALGAKGIGGVPGSNDGIVGVKQDVLKVQ